MTTNTAAIIFLDRAKTVIGWSEGAAQLLGWSEGEVVGLPLGNIRSGVDGLFISKSDRAVRLLVSQVPSPDGGTVLSLRSESAMTMREQLELTLSHSDVIGTWDWDVTQDRVYTDARFAQAFGTDVDNIGQGLALSEFVAGIHVDDRERVSAEIARTLESSLPFVSEYRLYGNDKTIRHVLARGRLVVGDAGQPTRFPGVLFDLTARKEAERQAYLHEGRYRSVFEKLDAGFCVIEMIFDEQGAPVDYVFLDVNTAFETQTGLKFATGQRMRTLSPHHEQHWFDLYGKVATTGEPIYYENDAASLGFYYSVRAFPIDDAGSNHVGVLFSDISERRRTELALRKSESEFRTLSQSMLNHVWTARPDGQLDWFNDRVYEFSGHAEGELDGDKWAVIVHEEDLPGAASSWAAALSGTSVYQTEFRLRRHDGVYRWHLVRAIPIIDETGTVTRWVGTNTDIDHAKKNEQALAHLNVHLENRIEERTNELMLAEKALQQSQKMETIGKLTGGVAHDFNNLLQVVAGNLQLLAKDVVGNERAERRVTNALAGVNRGAKLASQLLAFGRRQALEPKVINVGRFISGMDDLLRRSIGEAIDIEVIVGGGLWNTYADPTQVENALLNLSINARDAMNGSGKLTIEVGNAALDQAYARTHSEVKAGQYVMLAVTDSGSGMSADVLENVFEPFFSTKPEGKGTGLGLSMVYGFVKQSGGHVKIYSEIGHGTTVKIYLPRAFAPEDREVVLQSGPIVGGTETVLVVEDDDEVRATVIETLKDLGYNVLMATNAQNGLSVVESGVPIDVLFTDVVMPGALKSPELARRAKERLPGLAVLFTSGYTENSIVHGGKLDPGVELLSKPYTREALARRLRHVLANRKQAIHAETAPRSRAPSDILRPPQTGSTVLLVEDDDLIRMNTAEMMADIGHTVLEAASGAQALTLLQARRIDILVTDLGLPDMSGSDVAAAARTLDPNLAVIFATGDSSLPNGAVQDAILLSKPYDAEALRSALHAVAQRAQGFTHEPGSRV